MSPTRYWTFTVQPRKWEYAATLRSLEADGQGVNSTVGLLLVNMWKVAGLRLGPDCHVRQKIEEKR